MSAIIRMIANQEEILTEKKTNMMKTPRKANHELILQFVKSTTSLLLEEPGKIRALSFLRYFQPLLSQKRRNYATLF